MNARIMKSDGCAVQGMEVVPFKDRNLVTQKIQLSDAIKCIAEILRKSESAEDRYAYLRDVFLDGRIGSKEHHPNHKACKGMTPAHNGREKEKRICHCMYHYMKNPEVCEKCSIENRWKNVGKIKVTEFEMPTRYVYEQIGGIDLIFDDIYAVEVKPPRSSETIARMFAEILTYTIDERPDGRRYKPAICLFNLPENEQMKQFQQLMVENKADMDYITRCIKVFYFEVSDIEEKIIEFSIHPIEELYTV